MGSPPSPLPRDAKRHPRPSPSPRDRPPDHRGEDHRGGDLCPLGGGGGRRASAPDAAVAVSPSFLGLFPVLASARLRRFPWILWLEDILPDAAVTTGLMREGPALRTAQRLERFIYRSADRIVVISNAFRENLLAKGVPPWKVAHIYNPYTRGLGERRTAQNGGGPARILYMGNMGFSQNLPALVRAFEHSPAVGDDVRLILAGTGELALEAAAEIRSTRVEMPGLLLEELETEIERAAIGLVPQRPDVDEFNLPSKLMNLMSRGVPVLASVNPSSEIARIVRESGAGWVVDAADPEGFPRALRGILADQEELERRGAAGLEFARRNFSPEVVATRFEDLLYELTPPGGRRGGRAVSLAVITGSTGLIGSEAASYFGGLGMDVVGIDNDMRQRVLRRRGVDRLESIAAGEGARWALSPPPRGHPGPSGSGRGLRPPPAGRSSSSSTRPRNRHTTGRRRSRSPTSTSTRSAR